MIGLVRRALAGRWGTWQTDQGPVPTVPRFSFCEPVTATEFSPWHIRQLTNAGRKLGGGVDADALCGRQITRMGWDLTLEVTVDNIAGINRNSSRRVCDGCADAWRQAVGA